MTMDFEEKAVIIANDSFSKKANKEDMGSSSNQPKTA
jgi:hypothetical protein